MFETNFSTLIVISFIVAVLAYRVSFIRNKTIGYFSLLQIIYLVLIPGLIFPLVFSYLRDVSQRPLILNPVFTDGMILNVTLLALLFTYGGMAVHSITKMIEEYLLDKVEQEHLRMVHFIHFTFSHNLIYSGALLGLLGLTLLELNHPDPETSSHWWWLFLKGFVLMVGWLLSIYNYRPYAASRWSDMKSFFLVGWVALMIILYSMRKVDPSIKEYQLLVPALMSYGLMSFLSIVLVLRKTKQKWVVHLSQKRLFKVLRFWEV